MRGNFFGDSFREGLCFSGWLDLVPVEGDVGPGGLVGEGAGGDEVGADFGEGAEGVEGDAAAGLGFGAVADLGEGVAEGGGGKIVEQQDVGSGGERGGNLLRGVDFALDEQVGSGGAGLADERGQTFASGGMVGG